MSIRIYNVVLNTVIQPKQGTAKGLDLISALLELRCAPDQLSSVIDILIIKCLII